MTMLLETSVSGRKAAASAAPAERHAIGHLLTYWRLLAASEGIPPRARVDLSGPAALWENVFIIRVAGSPADYRFERAGPAVARLLGGDPTGKRLGDVMPSSVRERILFFQKAAVAMRSPVDEAGQWREASGALMRFRMIVLPLSDDQIQVNYLLGALTAGPLDAD